MLVQKPFQDIITFTRASAATRFNASGVLETVGNNVPRIDYDPVTLDCRGFLIEGQRTNIISRSVDIGFAHNPAGAVLTPNFGTAPDGTQTSSRVVVGTGTFNFNFPAASAEDVSGTPYCYSIFFKPKAFTGSVTLYVGNGTSTGGVGFAINVASVGAAPVITGAGNGNGVGSVSGVGNGWWRLNFPYIATANNAQPTLTFATGWAAGTDVEFWGRQREIGNLPTSYIQTSGSQVTRAASDCKISTLSPWFSQQGGVLLLDYLPMGGDGVVAEFHNTANNRWGVTRAANGDMTAATVSAGTADGSAVVAGASPAGQIRRAAVSLAANDLRISVNGGAVSKDASVSLPVNLSVLQLGARQGLTTPFNGWLRKVRYIPKPVASDAELQALSTI